MSKRVVHYNIDEYHANIKKGLCAIVVPFDHPDVKGHAGCHTSTVVDCRSVNFETENTKYIGITKEQWENQND